MQGFQVLVKLNKETKLKNYNKITRNINKIKSNPNIIISTLPLKLKGI